MPATVGFDGEMGQEKEVSLNDDPTRSYFHEDLRLQP